MATTTSGVSKVGSNYYKTSVTTNADGSLKATTFRTDSTGGGATAVSTVNTTADGTSTRSFESGATTAEKAAFSDPKSPERQAYSQQVQSQNPYGSNPTATQKQNLAKAAGGSGNTASETNVGAATSATYTQQEAIAAIEGKDIRTSYRTDLSYPINRNAKQDYIKFEMLEYSPRKFTGPTIQAFSGGVDAGLGQEVFGSRKDRNPIGTVTLPISSPISDTNTVNWSDDTIGALESLAQGTFFNLVGGSGQGNSPQSNPNQPSGQPQGGSGATKALAVTALSQAAVKGGSNLLTRTTGAITNPNLELLFNGPSLRTFSFTFPLSARSEKEAQVIKEIIRFFKQGMSVKRSKSAIFLKSPHTFNIKYIYADGKNKDNPWINLIKECALTNCTVNYTPAGNYATYANGAMTMYEITLNFSELEPIFDDDYAKIDGNAAGKDTMIGY